MEAYDVATQLTAALVDWGDVGDAIDSGIAEAIAGAFALIGGKVDEAFDDSEHYTDARKKAAAELTVHYIGRMQRGGGSSDVRRTMNTRAQQAAAFYLALLKALPG